MSEEVHYLEFFTGGVPPKVIFQMDLDDMRTIAARGVEASKANERSRDRTAELCLVGAVAYFEAFFKNQFAAVGNICPALLRTFAKKRDEAAVRLSDLLRIPGLLESRLGSVLSEQYDFGSPRTVNSLFLDLLGVSPFSKDEAKRFDTLLVQRNLIVHYGGIYTYKYHRQNLSDRPVQETAHWHFLTIANEEFVTWAEFLESMAGKTAQVTQRVMVQCANDLG
jgi:hypothetical protein